MSQCVISVVPFSQANISCLFIYIYMHVCVCVGSSCFSSQAAARLVGDGHGSVAWTMLSVDYGDGLRDIDIDIYMSLLGWLLCIY